MTDEQFDPSYVRGEGYLLTDFEPVFDAADIARFGRDLLFQRSNVSNDAAITWLQRHLGDRYRVHRVEFADDRAMHIDATFVPLAPGKVLVNPERPIKNLPDMFKKAGWDLLEMPASTYPTSSPFWKTFKWFHMNVLSLDEKRVIVEKNEEPFIRALKDWGFEPIPVAFRSNYKYGGSFHCATVDIRRRGTLQSYF
jgi:glycine amidinotransferase